AERLAPVPFSTVCFRWRPRRLADRLTEPGVEARLDRLNEALLHRLNAEGNVFLSHTVLDGRFTLRLAIGNLRTEARHVELAWDRIRALGAALEAEGEAEPDGEGT
ncbi:MAG TPA: hypothetical protein VFW86_04410, partial [Candidatus Limnocylindrales bacterium]|nr:hypothetical protein [Candidatus Limnocylindrales bacterium]